MKKITILLSILALAFMAASAFAYTTPLPAGLTNEVTNGDFQTGNFNGWTNDSVTGYDGFTIGGGYFAQSSASTGYQESVMYQIIDESQHNVWLQNGTGKDWWFTFRVKTSTYNPSEAYVFYYNSNPSVQPAFGGPDNPGDGWVRLYYSNALPSTGEFVTVETNGQILGFQPQWIAVAFEGLSYTSENGSTYQVKFDDVGFYGQCQVPLPPSVLLLGSGLLGLGGYAWRRRRS
jgi:hypothetical protein